MHTSPRPSLQKREASQPRRGKGCIALNILIIQRFLLTQVRLPAMDIYMMRLLRIHLKASPSFLLTSSFVFALLPPAALHPA